MENGTSRVELHAHPLHHHHHPDGDLTDIHDDNGKSQEEDLIPSKDGSPSSSIATEPQKNVNPSVTYVTKRKSIFTVIVFSLAVTGNITSGLFSNAVLFPIQVREFIGEEHKATMLAILGLIISIVTALSGPIVGKISDQLKTKIGRRFPFLILSFIIGAIVIVIRGFLSMQYLILFILNVVLQIIGKMTFIIIQSIIFSMIPETFPQEQHGVVGGIKSFITLVSSGLGIALSGFLFPILGREILVITMGLFLLSNAVLHLICFREPSIAFPKSKKKWIEWVPKEGTNGANVGYNVFKFCFRFFIEILSSFKHWDLTFIFISRFVYLLGFEMIQVFALYMLFDKIGDGNYAFIIWKDIAKTSEQALAIVMIGILGAGLLTSVIAGIINDKSNIKSQRLLAFFGIFMTLGSVGLSVLSIFPLLRPYEFNIVIICGILIGIGVGGCDTIGVPLLFAVIHENTPDDVAQNSSIFITIVNVLPRILSSAIGGFFIFIGNYLSHPTGLGWIPVPYFGYNLMLLSCALFSIVGSILILPVRIGRKQKNSQPQVHRQEELQDHHPDINDHTTH